MPAPSAWQPFFSLCRDLETPSKFSLSNSSATFLSNVAVCLSVINPIFSHLDNLLRQPSAKGSIWMEDKAVLGLLDRSSVEFNVEVAEAGGLEEWLTRNTNNISVQRNTIVHHVGVAEMELRELFFYSKPELFLVEAY